jgi:hypothetical protein
VQRRRFNRSSSYRSLQLAVATLLVGLGSTAASGTASATDSPSGYYFGSDSNYPSATGGLPYTEPGTGGLYGSYTGEIGTWTNWLGCTHGDALNLTDVRAVNADAQRDPAIPGLSLYWFMAGPGADPAYNGTVAEAFAWGQAQAEQAEADYVALAPEGIVPAGPRTPMLYMDIEGQPAAGYANGWNEIVNSCGQITKAHVIPVLDDRAAYNGFYDYIHLHTIFHAGVYSTPDFWTQTFGTGPASRIPNTYEWTPETSTPATMPEPVGFQQGAEEATWFGGVSVSHQAGWQWTQNGGDWDQMDGAHLP